MTKIVGVRFRNGNAGKIYYFDPRNLDIKRGEHVIVETARGVEYGYVVVGVKEIADAGLHFDHIVCACGSGGTAAGSILGAKIYMPDPHVVCSMVDSDPFDVIVPELMKKAEEDLFRNCLLRISCSVPSAKELP